MLFGKPIDSAPAELPIKGLEAELHGDLPAVPAVELPATLKSVSPDPLATMSAIDDPGFAAALAGGATFSEPVQWLFVTLAGLCCAAMGRELIASRTNLPANGVVQKALLLEPGGSLASIPNTRVEENRAAAVVSSPVAVTKRATSADHLIREAGEDPEPSPSRTVPIAALLKAQLETPVGDVPASTEESAAERKTATAIVAKKAGTVSTPCVPTSRARLFVGKRR